MANIIISQSAKTMPGAFGQITAPIKEYIERRDLAYQQESYASKIFTPVKSTHFAEGYTGLTGTDDWMPIRDAEGAPTNGFQEGYTKILRNVTWATSFSITRQAIEDDQVGVLDGIAGPRQDSYEKSRERFFARLLGEASQGNTSFTLGVEEFDLTSADGVCVFSKAHKPKVKGDDQSNVFSNEFSATALSKVISHMHTLRDDNNDILGVNPNTIIIPDIPELVAEVHGVLGAYSDPATPGGNKYNYLFGTFNIWPWKYLNQFIKEGTAPWFILDSDYNKKYKTLIDQQRVDCEWTVTFDEGKKIQTWDGYARYSGGFNDFRGVAVGGVANGTTL